MPEVHLRKMPERKNRGAGEPEESGIHLDSDVGLYPL